MSERWYDQTVSQIEEKLNTNVNTGLTHQVLRSRQKNDEMNVIYPIFRHSFETCFKKIAFEPTTFLLLLCSLAVSLISNSIATWVIFGIVCFNVLVSVFLYNKSHRIFEDMGRLSLPTTKVLRNGKVYLIKSEQLVKGDVIYLSAGDMVPADARLIEADKLQVLEVNLTGAIKPAEKDANFIRYTHDIAPSGQANMIFASTIVIKGTAKAVCCCTGSECLACKMEKNKPIQKHDEIRIIDQIVRFGKIWSLLMIALVFFAVVLMLVFGGGQKGLFDIFITALSLSAATTGEFFILSAYVIVANGLFSAVKQKKQVNTGALIKNISKIEQLKDLDCLIVNKDGAFSMRDVRVRKVFVNNSLYTDGEVHFVENTTRILRFALISTGLYGADKIIDNNLSNENIYTPEEDAIIAIAQKNKVYNIDLDKNYPILDHIPSGEYSKFDTTLVNSSRGYTVACRGDLEAILSCCSFYIENGKMYPLDQDRKYEIVSEAIKLSRSAYRIIGVSTKITQYNTLRRLISCQSDMVFEGFIAIRERMAPGVAKRISQCKSAGIKVIMLCDDVGEHNRVLAEALGIIQSRGECATGSTLNSLKHEMFRTNISIYNLYEGLNIYQKRNLLSFLREEGHTVGVLSRELDEIILLKEADVGYVQSTTLSGKLDKAGIDMTLASNTRAPMLVKNSKDSKKTGSEALKFIADVIISDSDKSGKGGFNAIFDSICAAKTIYSNLSKVVKYLLTSQFSRFLILIYSILTQSQLISPQQLIISGLIVDLIAMCIFSFERPDHKKIKESNEPISFAKIISMSLLSGIVWADSVIIIPPILRMIGILTVATQTSVVFFGFIISQVIVLNELIRDDSIFKGPFVFNGAKIIQIIIVTALIVTSMLIPQVSSAIGVTKISWHAMLLSLIPSVIMIITFEIHKFILKKLK